MKVKKTKPVLYLPPIRKDEIITEAFCLLFFHYTRTSFTREFVYSTRSVLKSQIPFSKTKFFKNSFFPAVIMEWNKIDVIVRNSTSCNVFKRVILKLIRTEPSQVFNVESS